MLRVHKRCCYIRGQLEKDKCQSCVNQQEDRVEVCLKTKLNDQSLEIVERFCYLCNTIRGREDAVDNVIRRIRSGWSGFRDLVSQLTSRCFPSAAKGRFTFLYSVVLSGSEPWPVKEEDVIKL